MALPADERCNSLVTAAPAMVAVSQTSMISLISELRLGPAHDPAAPVTCAQHAEQLASRLMRTAAVRQHCRDRSCLRKSGSSVPCSAPLRGCRFGCHHPMQASKRSTGWGPAQLQCSACCQAYQLKLKLIRLGEARA